VIFRNPPREEKLTRADCGGADHLHGAMTIIEKQELA